MLTPPPPQNTYSQQYQGPIQPYALSRAANCSVTQGEHQQNEEHQSIVGQKFPSNAAKVSQEKTVIDADDADASAEQQATNNNSGANNKSEKKQQLDDKSNENQDGSSHPKQLRE